MSRACSVAAGHSRHAGPHKALHRVLGTLTRTGWLARPDGAVTLVTVPVRAKEGRFRGWEA